MIKHLRLLYLLLFLYSFAIHPVQAQNSFGSEEELKKQAQKLFDEEEFEEAYPLYSQLTSLYSKDPVYNYRLGVCMIYASDDKEKPIPFLEFASKNPDIEKEVFFYLAKAYHLNYRFDDAIAMYVKYRSVAKPAKLKSLQVERQIEMCKNGRKLLKNVTDLVVLEKKELNKAEFFRSYDISSIGGKLLVKPDDPAFKSSIDKKKKEKSIIYLSSDNSQIFFSSYGISDENGKDIFISRKLPTGEWGKPQTLGYPINTQFDEDYPFLHPNGRVLYFCSKGHNSMGGYDVFKSSLDEKTNTWSTPVNMDFPINTPDDDILYVTDKNEKEAYFSSARSSIAGKTSVYHIDVNRKPADVSVIAGVIVKNREKQALDVKITVKNVADNVILGVYNSSASNGEYQMNLPNGGKFMFTVEATGLPTQSEIVALPVQYELKPLKQEISYELKTDKLKINNLFDATSTESSYLLALNYIKEKSKLDVTAANEVNKANDLAKQLAKAKADSIANYKAPLPPKTDNSIANNQLVQNAYKAANEDEKELRELKEQAAIATELANQKGKLAEIKSKEGNQVEAEQLNKETAAAFNLSKKLEQNADAKQKEAYLSMKYAKNLEEATKSSDVDAAILQLNPQKEEVTALNEKNKGLNNSIEQSYKNNVDIKQKELDKTKKVSVYLKQEIVENETLIKNYKADLEKTKKKDVKQGIENQIAALKQDNIDRQKELDQNNVKVAQVQKEYEGVKGEADMVASVLGKSKTQSNQTYSTTTAVSNPSAVVSNKTETVNKMSSTKSTTIETPVMLKQVNTRYENELSKAEAVSSEAAKEKMKADILEKWAKAIDAEIITKKKEFITSTDETNKKQLTQEILSSEKIAKEKHDAATVSLQKSKTLAANETASAKINTTNTANSTTPSPVKENASKVVPSTTTPSALVYNKQYQDELKSVEATQNPIEKETKKYEIYNNWTDAITAEIEAKKKGLEKTEDDKKRMEIRNEITSLQNDLSEKETIAEAIATNLESLKAQPATASNKNTENTETKTESIITKAKTTTEPGITKRTNDSLALAKNNVNKTPDPPVDKNVPPVPTESKTSSSKNMIGNTELGSVNVSEKRQKATATYKEANDLLNQSNELKTKAADAKELNQKNAVFEEAEILVRQSERKQLAAAAIEAEANKEEYSQNFYAVEEIAKVNKVTDADDIVMAELIVDESKVYFEKAQKLREDAAKEPDFYTKNNALIEAKDNEQLAIKKQQQAFEIYKKYNPSFIVSTNAVTEKNTVTKTQNESVVEKATTPIATKSSNEKAVSEKLTNSTTSEPTTKTVATTTPTIVSEKAAVEKTTNVNASESKNNKTVVNSTSNITSEKIAAEKTINSTASESTTNKTPVNSTTVNENKSVEKNATVPIKNEAIVKATTTPIKENKTIPNTLPQTTNEFLAAKSASTNKNNSKTVATNSEEKKSIVPPKNNELVGTTKNSLSGIQLAAEERFETKTTSTYSTDKPIPINERLPEGLIFKVQIGAFKNAIPQDLFSGITPITGESTSVGLTRYTAGFFKKFVSANKVKNTIKELGYKDAFVVAFYNGKRVSMIEALAIAGESLSVADNSSSLTNVNSNETINAPIAKSEKIEKVAGLFYTVQVGVYSQPVSPDKIFNIQPLYSETTPTGYIRYTTGMYNNVDKAAEAKNSVVNVGVKDAFVVAYNQGKRVSLSEALQIGGNGSTSLATSPNVNKLPIQESMMNTVKPSTNNGSSTNATIVFKIQIGAFREEVPLDMVNKFLNISSKGIENYKDATGLTVYTLGNFKTYEEAVKLKNETISASIPGAFIIAYKNGNKISVEEAKQLIK